MSDDGDLALLPELIERSFGSGPDGLPGPVERLAVGRRALRRRRRIGVAGTSVAVAAAIGVGVALSGAGGDHGADGAPLPLATQGVTPSRAATPSQDPVDTNGGGARTEQNGHRQAARLVSGQFPASFDVDGNVVVRTGWRIVQRIANPMGFAPPEASLGVVVTKGDATRWMLITLERMQDGAGHALGDEVAPTASADDPGKGYSRFEDWLASMVELNGGARTPPLLTVDAADHLTPGPGAALVDQRPAPLIDGYTTYGDRMAEVRRDGRTWFLVVRGHGARADVVPVDADVLAAPTFEAFVAHLTRQTSSGEGVR